MKIKEHINYSEPVQDIMGVIPSWITRWGILIIFILFLLILLGCCYIRYPQTLSSEIVMSAADPPFQMVARYSGMIDSIAVYNGQVVSRGDLLALFSTTAKYADIMILKDFVNTAQCKGGEDVWMSPLFSSQLQLGDLQASWTTLLSIYNEYKEYLRLDLLSHRMTMTRANISKTQEYIESLKDQCQILEADTELHIGMFERDSILFLNGVISKNEYDLARQALLSKQATLTGFKATVQAAENNLFTLQQSLDEIHLQRCSDESQFCLRLSDALRKTESMIDDWLKTYAFIAPIDGVVSLQDYWGSGQYVASGEVIASIVPIMQERIRGRMKVPSAGFGKVSIGQDVKIQLNGFPYLEYGVLWGRVSEISQVPEKGLDGDIYYIVDVDFPDSIISTYGIEFPLIQGMDGVAQIITEDTRLIEYFLKPIKSLIINL